MVWLEIATYLLAVNLVTFMAYAVDKARAQRQEFRISEAFLLSLGLFGGTPAALAAQRILRHKTRKESFQFQFWLTVAVQTGLMAVAFYSLVEPLM